MKLILRQYLESLRERDELDAILPDLLSELGFTVFSRPKRGAAESGVDVAAVAKVATGERTVFLLAIKRGDLTRQEWDGTPQGLRSTLNEILDVYIPTKLPARFQVCKIVICVCLGGDVHPSVRVHVTNYFRQQTTERISFEEWNGDAIAQKLMEGPLREELLPKDLRSHFRKSVAMVDEPDISYLHFARLARQLAATGQSSQRARVRTARQLFICLWVLFVWARDADNVEAPYRASELALLVTWDLIRPLVGKRTQSLKALSAVLGRLVVLHLAIAGELIERKTLPHSSKRYAISAAVASRSPADINLKLFDILGRIAVVGLWHQWLADLGRSNGSELRERGAFFAGRGLELIRSNPCLLLPLCDHQAVDIALFLLLAVASEVNRDDIASWLSEMAKRLCFTVRTHGRYPCVFHDYAEVLAHPREKSDEYRREATSGSTLIPLLSAWLLALGRAEEVGDLVELKGNELSHCTLQLWLPDSTSEDLIYRGGHHHGVAICPPLTASADDLLEIISEACRKEDAFSQLTAVSAGYWPIILLACRHFRIPVPPNFWINVLYRSDNPQAAGEEPGQEEHSTDGRIADLPESRA